MQVSPLSPLVPEHCNCQGCHLTCNQVSLATKSSACHARSNLPLPSLFSSNSMAFAIPLALAKGPFSSKTEHALWLKLLIAREG